MNAIYLYRQYRDVFNELEAEDCKMLLLAMMNYWFEEAAVELPKHLRPLWILIKSNIDNDRDAYNERCERNRNNGSRGGRPRKTDVVSVPYTENAAETSETVKEEKAAKPKRTVFTPPTEEECKEYFAEKGVFDESEASRFYTHFDANGWMIGRYKMKKWKQAASNWILNMNKYSGNGTNKRGTKEEARRAIYEIFNGG